MINKPTLIITALLAFITFIAPRKYFCFSYIAAACFVPADQRIILMGLDFTVLRVLVVVGIFRMLVRAETRNIHWNRFDKMVFAWVLCGAVIYSIQWMNTRAIINRVGLLFDVAGLYWLFRQTIRSWADIKVVVNILAVCVLVLAPFIIREWATGRNPFSILGRVTTYVRDQRYRCQAAFPHSIMLGLFWATTAPLFAGFARQSKHKLLYGLAIGAVIFIVASTASTTPILTLVIVSALICMYKWRYHVNQAAWTILFTLICLHLIMEAPVWHLIARANVLGGSTGWHRFHVIDQAVNHFGEWAILGCRNTRHWGWGLEDITNQYVLEGVRGGLISLFLFVAMLYMASKSVLRMCLREGQPERRFVLWCIFITLIGHFLSFFGVSYFGQITMLWYMILSMVGFLIELDACHRRLVRRTDKPVYYYLSQPEPRPVP